MNLLITGAWKPRQEALASIAAMGHSVYFQPMESDPPSTDFSRIQGVIGNGLFLHHSPDDFPCLRYVQLTSAGFDRVPVEELQARGVLIHNARGVYSIPMAEFALAGVLQLYKQMDHFRCAKQNHLWSKHRGVLELFGKKLCVLGCGSVGQACAKVFSALGCEVEGVDIAPFTSPYFRHIYPLESLDQALGRADVVILCLPLLAGTLRLFDETRFSKMKDGAVFVNISRGKLVDSAALLTALRERLRGAVLDVFEEEPLGQESPLWNMDNVVLTPHNSFVGDGNGLRLEKVILENLEKFS